MVKLRLKHYNIPAGGMWYYNDPMSGKVVSAVTYDNLINKLYELYRVNGWPIGLDFENQVQAGLCDKHPGECAPELSTVRRRRRRMTWGDIMRGTAVLMSFKAAGSPIVDKEEANRRADICSACSENVEFDKPCGSVCDRLRDIVRSVIGQIPNTKAQSRLKACAICHCWLEAAVHIPLEHQCKGVTEEMKTAFAHVPNCWKTCYDK
jgi:hypothetical protein